MPFWKQTLLLKLRLKDALSESPSIPGISQSIWLCVTFGYLGPLPPFLFASGHNKPQNKSFGGIDVLGAQGPALPAHGMVPLGSVPGDSLSSLPVSESEDDLPGM